MSDPRIDEFYNRVHRIERNRAMGFGHEAAGTLGRSHFVRPKGSPLASLLRKLMVLGVLVIGAKAAMIHAIGADAYDDRVALMMQGEGVDRLGGVLLQADPVSRMVALRAGAFLSETIEKNRTAN